MDPKAKINYIKTSGFVGDKSMESDFDQDEVSGPAKKSMVDVNDGVGLIDKLPGSEE